MSELIHSQMKQVIVSEWKTDSLNQFIQTVIQIPLTG